MRYSALLVFVAALSAADEPKSDAAKEELKKLEGTWTLVSGEMDGKPLTEQAIKVARLVIKGDRHTVKGEDDNLAGTHTVDPGKKPKAIDSTQTEGRFKGKTLLGICELDGDQFKVCFAEPGKERPKEFTTKSGTGYILHVWKRQKDK